MPQTEQPTNQLQQLMQDANNASNQVDTIPGQVLDEDIDDSEKTMQIVDRVMKARNKK